ncbi:MAG: heme lyase CcmF/NrfE family subunit [Acidobacteriota bacterium]|jgi:cytochrome c-type biogenesis protein CcmF|nr:heme lyase CcmF/NrfE family subunit [Acidobacteriota bacterium]
MANFGNFCTLLALCLSLYAIVAALTGAFRQQERVVRSAERAAYAAAGCASLAFFSLLYLLLADDFSIAHVASSSSLSLPVIYKITAVWGGHDGSMLLWAFFAAVMSAIALWQIRGKNRDMMPYVLAVLMVNLSFFLALSIFLSNPFQELVRVFPDGSTQPFIPADGQGLNPLLQYWAMVIHPPILYLGYIGFMVPFAFAVGALATRQRGEVWIRATRRWTLWTWLFLGAGLIIGGKWAYVVLGWGGYWGWDPVENAALMPWLTATAFLHSVIVQERRGMLKIWNMVLIAVTYLLCIFGTFLTRSGIVNSVHAFDDSNIGKFFVYYIIIVLGVTLILIMDRREYLRGERRLESMTSRESAFLFNNLILVVACFAVFWGTMFPVFSEWIRGVKISVGPVFFNKINIPVGLLLLLFTGIGPLFAWRKTPSASIKKMFLRPVVAAFIVSAGLLTGGMSDFYALICFALCAFVITAIIEEFYRGARARGRSAGESFPLALWRLTWKNRRRYGGNITHFGVALLFIGFAGNAFNEEATGYMRTGDEMRVGGYTLKMAGLIESQTADYRFGELHIEAYKNGRLIKTLKPERRIYDGQSTTVVGLYSTPKEDLYTVYTGMTEDMRCEVKARVNPLVFWVWAGSALMFLGTLIAIGSKGS